MTKIQDILSKFDEQYGSFALSDVVNKKGYEAHKSFLRQALREVVESVGQKVDELKVECEPPGDVIPTDPNLAADQSRNFALEQVATYLQSLKEELKK